MNRHVAARVAPVNPPIPQVTSLEAAQKLASHLLDVMNALIKAIEQESDLVRVGRIADAMSLDAHKSDLSRRYVTAISHLRANQPFMAQHTPDLLKALHRHHDTFRAMLQINLTVLATAHAVSEGIVRGVQGEIRRRLAPQTYTARGQNATPGPSHVSPLAVSRTL